MHVDNERKRKQFVSPSQECYQKRVYILQNGGKKVTCQNFKLIKSNVLNSNGSFLLHIFVLHFIRSFLNLKN